MNSLFRPRPSFFRLFLSVKYGLKDLCLECDECRKGVFIFIFLLIHCKRQFLDIFFPFFCGVLKDFFSFSVSFLNK